MPTKNPRYNIIFDSKIAGTLTSLAEQENKSISSLVNELILEALDHREDMVLSEITKIRDTQKQKMIAPHDAWK